MAMNTIELCKSRYFLEMQSVFKKYPIALRELETHWQKHEYRIAYIKAQELIEKSGLELSMIQKEVDEGFYWNVIN